MLNNVHCLQSLHMPCLQTVERASSLQLFYSILISMIFWKP